MADFHYSEDVRDGKGNRIGSVRKIEGFGSDVYDSNGSHVGNSNTFGTFDNNGQRIADKEEPGLLWKPKKS
jgi:hypothetical protein